LALEIIHHVIGPMQNNAYIIFDNVTNEAAVIDPGMGSEILVKEIKNLNLDLKSLLLTHAHFDHVACVDYLLREFDSQIEIGLHPDDLPLLINGAGAKEFGIDLNINFKPTLELHAGKFIHIGDDSLSVIHTPGHTPGHVTFYSKSLDAAFCGDLIFYHSIGRTDLKGSDFSKLMNSIKSEIFSLPPQTVLYNGHGPETTVKEEIANNPFLNKKSVE